MTFNSAATMIEGPARTAWSNMCIYFQPILRIPTGYSGVHATELKTVCFY